LLLFKTIDFKFKFSSSKRSFSKSDIAFASGKISDSLSFKLLIEFLVSVLLVLLDDFCSLLELVN